MHDDLGHLLRHAGLGGLASAFDPLGQIHFGRTEAPKPRRYSWKVVMSEASCHSICQQHRLWWAAASSRSAMKIDHSENYRVTAKVGCYSDPQ
jgi:hypothetical protein